MLQAVCRDQVDEGVEDLLLALRLHGWPADATGRVGDQLTLSGVDAADFTFFEAFIRKFFYLFWNWVLAAEPPPA